MATGLILQELSRYKTGAYARVLHRHALLRPNHTALIYGAERLSYAELNARASSLVLAVICFKPGTGPTAGEIIAFCRKHPAGFKSPKSVDFVEALPKNPSGKILKRELREKYRSQAFS